MVGSADLLAHVDKIIGQAELIETEVCLRRVVESKVEDGARNY